MGMLMENLRVQYGVSHQGKIVLWIGSSNGMSDGIVDGKLEGSARSE